MPRRSDKQHEANRSLYFHMRAHGSTERWTDMWFAGDQVRVKHGEREGQIGLAEVVTWLTSWVRFSGDEEHLEAFDNSNLINLSRAARRANAKRREGAAT